MAATKRLIRKKAPKRLKMTKGAAKTIDNQYYGAEPMIVDTDDQGERTKALNWYNYMYDADKARTFLIEYMRANKFPTADINAVKRVPKYNVPSTIGWLARIQTNGNMLSNPEYFGTRLAQLINEGIAIKKNTAPAKERVVVSIQDRMIAKNNALFADVEVAVIDERGSMYQFLISNEITPPAATFFLSKYQPILDEVMSDDEQVAEAYGKGLKAERAFWQAVIDDLDRYLNNKKAVKTRKPRAKKTKSAVDVVGKLKYQKEFPPLKIVSVNPAEIVGSSQVWVYQTKLGKLSMYNAVGPAGISVKGTTLIGFDVETSEIKRANRDIEGVIERILSGGKIQLRRIMPSIKAKAVAPSGRINSDTIILRVIK